MFSTFIKLQFVVKICVWPSLEMPLKTGFTVHVVLQTEEKLYRCDAGGKDFAHASFECTIGFSSREKTFKCDSFCKYFALIIYLNRHLITNTRVNHTTAAFVVKALLPQQQNCKTMLKTVQNSYFKIKNMALPAFLKKLFDYKS